MSHEDDVPVGGPDEPRQPEGVVGARRGRLHGGHLVGFDAAELGRGVQHADAPQERGVHLRRHRQVSRPARGLLGRATPRHTHPHLLPDSNTRHPRDQRRLQPGCVKIALVRAKQRRLTEGQQRAGCSGWWFMATTPNPARWETRGTRWARLTVLLTGNL